MSDFAQILHDRVREEQAARGPGADVDALTQTLRRGLAREAPQALEEIDNQAQDDEVGDVVGEPQPTGDRRRVRGKFKAGDTEKATWLQDAFRPNIHAGAHLMSQFEQYASLANVDKLLRVH